MIFCTVIKISACDHIKPSKVGGNQKWKGAEPAFNNKAADRDAENKCVFNIIITPEISKIVEPRAWIKKYFKAASDEYWLSFIVINGIKESKFNSNPIQAPNQELAQIEITIPKIKVLINKKREGENIIKKRKIRLS